MSATDDLPVAATLALVNRASATDTRQNVTALPGSVWFVRLHFHNFDIT